MPSPSPSASDAIIGTLSDMSNVIGWFVAPILVAVLTFFLTNWVVGRASRRRQRIERRRQIVSLMARADSLIEEALLRGEYDSGARGDKLSIAPEYQELTLRVMALFEWGEEEVGLWCGIELACALDAPAHALEVARRQSEVADSLSLRVGWDGLYRGVIHPTEDVQIGFHTVRFHALSLWAEGKGRGPRFGTGLDGDSGDRARHDVYPPGHIVPGTPVPYVWQMKDYRRWSERELLASAYQRPYSD